jgi:hypothetical protein
MTIPWMKIKEDGDSDREGPRIPPIKGNVVLSCWDAAYILGAVMSSPIKEAWMLDVLTHGSPTKGIADKEF